jgi:transposase
MGSTRRAFTPEYKQNAVSLVIDSGRSIADVARGIGVNPQSLGNWVKKARAQQPVPTGLDKTERQELEDLRHENADLKMKLEFAKKVAAWFANQQR